MISIRYKDHQGFLIPEPSDAVGLNKIKSHFSYLDPSRYMVKSYRNGYWDGYRRMIGSGNSFPKGLIHSIIEFCKKTGISIDDTNLPEDNHRAIIQGLSDKVYGEQLEGITLADHQKRMVKSLLENGGGIVEGVTGCGKTESISLLIKILSERLDVIFVLVHRIGLMEQSYSRFILRCPELKHLCGMLGDGKKPEPGCRFIFSTQQSLSIQLSSVGDTCDLVRDLWSRVGAVIVDECHNVSQESYQKLLRTSTPNSGLYLFSGTPETDDVMRDWCILGIGGKIVCRVQRPELEQLGFIAKAVACIRIF